MNVHEPVGGSGGLILSMIGLNNVPHLACAVCEHMATLRSPCSPELWWLVAVFCAGVVAAADAKRTHAVARLVRGLAG